MESSTVVSNKEALADIGLVLFQIHALAKILEQKALYKEKEPTTTNNYSDEDLSITEIIVEKLEFCLDAIDKK